MQNILKNMPSATNPQTGSNNALHIGPIRSSCQLQPWSDVIHLRLARRYNGKLHTANSITFSETPEGQSGNPALVLHSEDAQQLMDELWLCGLRPSKGMGMANNGSADTLAATERHLRDMRDMAFCLLSGRQG